MNVKCHHILSIRSTTFHQLLSSTEQRFTSDLSPISHYPISHQNKQQISIKGSTRRKGGKRKKAQVGGKEEKGGNRRRNDKGRGERSLRPATNVVNSEWGKCSTRFGNFLEAADENSNTKWKWPPPSVAFHQSYKKFFKVTKGHIFHCMYTFKRVIENVKVPYPVIQQHLANYKLFYISYCNWWSYCAI